MTQAGLVAAYIKAWNRRDVAGVVALLHPGAAYYDAFWRETCVGHHLPDYLRDCLSEDHYWYELAGKVIAVEDGVVYRYSAYEFSDSKMGEKTFEGAEVFTIRDGKILTISNIYCDPDPAVLAEVARLAATRHGIPAFVDGGHAAYKIFHVKTRLHTLMTGDQLRRNRTLTVADLAEQLGCSVDHLLLIVNDEFGTNIEASKIRPAATCFNELLPN